jgi:predicted nucleotidyltransferase
MVTVHEKQALKRQLVTCLKGDRGIRKIIIFGSFLDSEDPGDMDVAVFQESRKGYLEPKVRQGFSKSAICSGFLCKTDLF